MRLGRGIECNNKAKCSRECQNYPVRMVYFHAGKANCPASVSDGMTLTVIVTSQ